MYMGGVGEAYRNSSAICLQTYLKRDVCACMYMYGRCKYAPSHHCLIIMLIS